MREHNPYVTHIEYITCLLTNPHEVKGQVNPELQPVPSALNQGLGFGVEG